MRIAVVNLKGGAGKTTTALHLAAALHGRGRAVTLVDSDPQGTALECCRVADTPWPAVAHTAPTIDTRADVLAKGGDLVIDTPPGHLEIARSALRAASVVVVPCQPTAYDLSQLAETSRLVAEVDAVTGSRAGVLLTRVFARTIASRSSRRVIRNMGLEVLETPIPNSQAFALSWGQPIEPGVYDQVLTELEGLEHGTQER